MGTALGEHVIPLVRFGRQACPPRVRACAREEEVGVRDEALVTRRHRDPDDEGVGTRQSTLARVVAAGAGGFAGVDDGEMAAGVVGVLRPSRHGWARRVVCDGA